MQPEFALTTISHTEIAIFLLTFLFVLLISVRKELSGDTPVRGVFQFGLAIIGLCTVVALMAAYFWAKKMVLPHSNAQRLDTLVMRGVFDNEKVSFAGLDGGERKRAEDLESSIRSCIFPGRL